MATPGANTYISTYSAADLQMGSLTLVGTTPVTAAATSTSNSGAKKTDVAFALVAGAAAGVGMLL